MEIGARQMGAAIKRLNTDADGAGRDHATRQAQGRQRFDRAVNGELELLQSEKRSTARLGGHGQILQVNGTVPVFPTRCVQMPSDLKFRMSKRFPRDSEELRDKNFQLF